MCQLYPRYYSCCGIPIRIALIFIAILSIVTGAIINAMLKKAGVNVSSIQDLKLLKNLSSIKFQESNDTLLSSRQENEYIDTYQDVQTSSWKSRRAQYDETTTDQQQIVTMEILGDDGKIEVIRFLNDDLARANVDESGDPSHTTNMPQTTDSLRRMTLDSGAPPDSRAPTDLRAPSDSGAPPDSGEPDSGEPSTTESPDSGEPSSTESPDSGEPSSTESPGSGDPTTTDSPYFGDRSSSKSPGSGAHSSSESPGSDDESDDDHTTTSPDSSREHTSTEESAAGSAGTAGASLTTATPTPENETTSNKESLFKAVRYMNRSGLNCLYMMFIALGILLLIANFMNSPDMVLLYVVLMLATDVAALVLLVGVVTECTSNRDICILKQMDWFSSFMVTIFWFIYVFVWAFFVAIANSFANGGVGNTL